jgi:Ca-activated chloride channel family protein
MGVNAERANLPRTILLGLCVLAFTAPAGRLARAQEGVTGTAPVYSAPKEEEPQAPDTAKQAPTVRVVTTLVTASVMVTDSSGQPLYDLSKDDFTVFDNGVQQKLQRFEAEVRPPAVVVVVQTNRRVAPLLDPVRGLGPNIAGLMVGPQGNVALVAYDEKVRIAQEFTNDSDQLSTALRKLVARGYGSRLNDALMRALALLEKQPKEQRRIILAFSDSRDQGSETTNAEVVRRATTAEVQIYGLGFSNVQALLLKKPETTQQGPLDANVTRPLPPGVPQTPTNSANIYSTPIPVVPILTAAGETIWSIVASNLLEYYAGYTGGVYQSHWKKKTLEEQLSRMATEINSQYELAYVPDNLSEMGFHRLEVRVRRSGARVRARAGYFYAGQPPPQN